MSNPLEAFAEHIFNSEFKEFPEWVDEYLFRQVIVNKLIKIIKEKFQYVTEEFSDREDYLLNYRIETSDFEHLLCPFTASSVDFEMFGKLVNLHYMYENDVYEFPDELIEYMKTC